jgi:hypothetical protein
MTKVAWAIITFVIEAKSSRSDTNVLIRYGRWNRMTKVGPSHEVEVKASRLRVLNCSPV